MLAKFKPAASRKTLLLVGALFWSVAGALLLARGGRLFAAGNHYLMLGVSLVVGTVKGFLVFEKSARKNIDRILLREDSSCIGGVFSIKAWGLILAMILLGSFLRSSAIFCQIYGFVITAVGWGLLLASRVIWQAWMRKA